MIDQFNQPEAKKHREEMSRNNSRVVMDERQAVIEKVED